MISQQIDAHAFDCMRALAALHIILPAQHPVQKLQFAWLGIRQGYLKLAVLVCLLAGRQMASS